MENWKFIVEIATMLVTAAMAGFTYYLARETRKLEKSWRETSTEQIKAWFRTSADQIGVKTWLELERRFDSEEMKNHRKTLGYQMPYKDKLHREIRDDVFSFFESVGIAYNNDCLLHKLAVASFSYHATCWWMIGKPYVVEERKRLRDDSIFVEFEKFVEIMTKLYSTVDQQALTLFLDGERHLCDDASIVTRRRDFLKFLEAWRADIEHVQVIGDAPVVAEAYKSKLSEFKGLAASVRDCFGDTAEFERLVDAFCKIDVLALTPQPDRGRDTLLKNMQPLVDFVRRMAGATPRQQLSANDALSLHSDDH